MRIIFSINKKLTNDKNKQRTINSKRQIRPWASLRMTQFAAYDIETESEPCQVNIAILIHVTDISKNIFIINYLLLPPQDRQELFVMQR